MLSRVKNVLHEMRRYGVTDLFEPADLMEQRNIPKVTRSLAQLCKLVIEALVEESFRRFVTAIAGRIDLNMGAIFVRPVLGGLMALRVQLRQGHLTLDEVFVHV